MKDYKEFLAKAKYRMRGHYNETIGTGIDQMKQFDQTILPDTYGTGAVIEDFQAMISKDFGMEQAVFFPSGTMAQQIALKIWCDEMHTKKVAYHPLSHLEIHEKDGLKVLHKIETVLLGEVNRLFTLKDMQEPGVLNRVSCVLFELPQREIGGQLPSWEELVEMTSFCHKNGIYTHLDGARLLEALPFYNKTAQEVCRIFDSVYISFYKSLGGVTGAMLMGNKEFMEKSKIWKRRYGGDLYHLYPYILSSRSCYLSRKEKMNEYWSGARIYAELLNTLPGVKTIPEVPVCNMFHVHFDWKVTEIEEALSKVIEKYDLALFGGVMPLDEGRTRTEIWVGDGFSQVPEMLMEEAVEEFGSFMKGSTT